MLSNTNSHPFKIYNASAGSGKTFSLVRDYLTILFKSKKPDAFRHILAITFTNKAVAEMKSRIVDSLIAFSAEKTPKDSIAMLDAVAEQTGIPAETIKSRSHHILKHLIHNYAAFEVSTIDGFTHRVLRTFAKDLGLPSNFEVTMQVDDILHEAVDRIIAKAGDDKLLTKTLIDFALSKTDDDKSWDISRELYEIAKLLTNESNLKHLKAIEYKSLSDFKAYSGKLNALAVELENQIIAIGEYVFKLLDENDVNDKANFSRGSLHLYFDKLINAKTTPVTGIDFTAKWQLTLRDKALYPSKKIGADKEAAIDAIQQQLADAFEDSKAKILQLDFIGRISKNIIPLSLLNTIKAEVEAIKKERSLILISEFNNTIAEAISDQPAPFIYERLGERYRHFFIDEFQDTSELQWQNLIPLAENPLTSLDESGQQGSLLIVGDAKQSIYRWRGGKAEQFIDLYNGKSPFVVPSKTENLPNNFRSLPEIVKFNNGLFKHLAKHFKVDDYANLYESSEQKITKNEQGYVNLKFFELANKEEEMEVFPEEVLKTIQQCEALGYKKSDICILTRKKKEGVAIADYLSSQGVSIISSETLLIKNSAEVNAIIDVLRLTENPKDDLTKVQLLQYLVDTNKVEREPTEFILESLNKDTEAFYESLQTYDIRFNPQYLDNLPLYDSLEYIINAFNLVSSSDAYVQYFLDFAFEYASQNIGGVSGFLEHWEHHADKLSIVVPQGQDAVQLLTIHRSKGLEFPVVIFPFANENLESYRFDSIWADLKEPLNDIPKAYISANSGLDSLDESVSQPFSTLSNEKQMDGINVLYVALTRAKEQLYVMGKREIAKDGPSLKMISGLLIEYLQSQGLWVDNQVEYLFGEAHQKVMSNDKASVETIEHDYFVSTSFEERSIALATNSGRLWGTTIQAAKDEGILIHDIMAEIDSASDVNTVIKRFINNGRIASSRKEELSEKINAIVTHPQLSEYFLEEGKNFNERDMVSANQEILRPDRINLLPNNEAVVIDYKTGLFNEANENQIDSYASALNEMGYHVTKRLLVYTNDTIEIKNV